MAAVFLFTPSTWPLWHHVNTLYCIFISKIYYQKKCYCGYRIQRFFWQTLHLWMQDLKAIIVIEKNILILTHLSSPIIILNCSCVLSTSCFEQAILCSYQAWALTNSRISLPELSKGIMKTLSFTFYNLMHSAVPDVLLNL